MTVVVVVVVGVVVDGGDGADEAVVGDNTVRFCCAELTHEGLWHHVAVVIHKASITKNSSVSLFIDGNYIATQKVRRYQHATSSLYRVFVLPVVLYGYECWAVNKAD